MDIIQSLCGDQLVQCNQHVDDVVSEARGLGIDVSGAADLLTETTRERLPLVETTSKAFLVCILSVMSNSASVGACTQLAKLREEVGRESIVVVLLQQDGLKAAESIALKHCFLLPVAAYGSADTYRQRELEFRQAAGLGLACQPPELVVFGRQDLADSF